MQNDTCEIVILETSDLHGFMLTRSYADHREVSYGLARIANLIREIRQTQPNTLLIDNGDCLQGTPLTYYHAKISSQLENPVIACMNELNYDAAVPGNHEFNYGLSYLQQAAKASSFPWLSANIIDYATEEPLFDKPYIVRILDNGVRIGILGLTTSHIPNWEQPDHIAGLRFDNPIQAAKRWVKHMKQVEQVDIVIVAYHGGFERDIETGKPTEALTGENVGYALCEQVQGIDVLLTGHQHRAICGAKINGVCIVQPASEGRYLGKVTLQLEKNEAGWLLTERQSELIEAAHFDPDERFEQLVAPVEALTQAWLDQPIGFVEGDMRITTPEQVRLREHPFIEFINRLQMDISGASISCTALFDNESQGFDTQITMRDIVSNYKYPNTLKVLRISGADIRSALEKSAQYFDINETGNIIVHDAYLQPKPQHYNYDMWEGISYTLDISKPIGQRVITLKQNDQPLVKEQLYEVVMNNYRASGGGEFDMFQGKPVVKDIAIDMVELIADYIRERRHIRASVNHNWHIVNSNQTGII
ncbi:bifunctional metallophosphatase/5'-nucleotidase [Paenibacillus septentrionalis]|uniref:Bifunctional metallophosphatase/5'-nucleotidase n=1 Tax=Paenibacillus septentrionalis TaxID=429342 RepID=A0ABW1UZS4_9BACL